MNIKPNAKIQVLSSDLIHRIAAGEVVDRPASALKELLENAIDSGARALRVQVVEGGLKRLEVEDDGGGFGRSNLEVAVQRHATSKISTLEDLDQIFTLGFRGEALAAIASVSKMSIDSKRAASEEPAYLLQVIGGSKRDIVPGLRKVGTKVTVDDLFFNVPARKKFLSKSSSEAKECLGVLEKLGLAHPEISLEAFLVDARGEIKDQLSLPASDAASRFGLIAGNEGVPWHLQSRELLVGFHKLEVFVFPPPVAHGNQKKIFLSVNGRSVVDKRLPYALREAFAGLIEVGQYPVAHVVVEVDPEKIDVNVHPQKKEIRWPNDVSLASLVYRLMRPHFEIKAPAMPSIANTAFDLSPAPWRDLESAPLSFAETRVTETSQSAESPGSETKFSSASGVPEPQTLRPARLTKAPLTSPSSSPMPQPPLRFSSLRVVGEVGAAWIVCESEAGLVLIDQHAAHERINFERILRQPELWIAKPLLIPVDLKIPYVLSDQISVIAKALESLGFELSDENFEQKIQILAVPSPARGLDWEKMLEKIFQRIEQERSLDSLLSDLKSQLAASLACHGSVRRGQRLSHDEIRQLLLQMDEVDWGGFCPHGRPVSFLLSHEKIEMGFHRS